MAWMSDRIANLSEELQRPGLCDRQIKRYLSNKENKEYFPKSVSHFFWRTLLYFDQSFNRSPLLSAFCSLPSILSPTPRFLPVPITDNG